MFWELEGSDPVQPGNSHPKSGPSSPWRYLPGFACLKTCPTESQVPLSVITEGPYGSWHRGTGPRESSVLHTEAQEAQMGVGPSIGPSMEAQGAENSPDPMSLCGALPEPTPIHASRRGMGWCRSWCGAPGTPFSKRIGHECFYVKFFYAPTSEVWE